MQHHPDPIASWLFRIADLLYILIVLSGVVALATFLWGKLSGTLLVLRLTTLEVYVSSFLGMTGYFLLRRRLRFGAAFFCLSSIPSMVLVSSVANFVVTLVIALVLFAPWLYLRARMKKPHNST